MAWRTRDSAGLTEASLQGHFGFQPPGTFSLAGNRFTLDMVHFSPPGGAAIQTVISDAVQDNRSTSAEPRPTFLAFVWMAGLVAFFFSTYAFSCWTSYLRHHVPSIIFGWEHHIPFLAWTIVPYWSVDPIYVLSVFLFRTRAELITHCKRLLAVQVISVAAFLLFPLRLNVSRPEVTGLLGWMFAIRTGIDPPFNEAPSLHIGFMVVLWAAYGRYLRGWALWLMRGWFLLTMLSTLTTYRHHFFDLPTGLWVGLFCLAIFPNGGAVAQSVPLPNLLRLRMAALHLAGALICAAAAYWLGGAGWLMLWPAGALAIVGGIWASGKLGRFRKPDGKLVPEMIVLLAPYLAVVWLASRWQWPKRRTVYYKPFSAVEYAFRAEIALNAEADENR